MKPQPGWATGGLSIKPSIQGLSPTNMGPVTGEKRVANLFHSSPPSFGSKSRITVFSAKREIEV